MLIEHPNLDCDTCFQFYRESPDYLPKCLTPGQVCPVESLALDEKLGEQVQLLTITKRVYDATMDPNVLKGPLTELGLYDDVLSHAEIEMTWSQWKAAQQKT